MTEKNLGNLISEIEEQYKKTCQELEEYCYIPEVEYFLNRRKKDLINFKKITSSYSIYISVISLKIDLRERFPRNHKYYGGICTRGAEYFMVTKKVKKSIDKELQSQSLYLLENNSNESINFDKDYCIPDELSYNDLGNLYQ